MRIDSPLFAAGNAAEAKNLSLVVGIIFDVASPYFTSHTDLINVPGNVVPASLAGLASVSQRMEPDEGRVTMSGITIEVADTAEGFTDEIRAKLQSGEGVRGAEVRIFAGYGRDFSYFQRVLTPVVESVDFDGATYTIQCTDRTREWRTNIFEPKTTNLAANISATATTIPVVDASEFQTVFHPASYSDAPGQTVGYARIKTTEEIIRFTGVDTNANTLTGVTRGVFGTEAKPVEFTAGADSSRNPEVSEWIYLELPGPMLAYAVLTGVIKGTAHTLPSHWHLGVAESLVDGDAFDAIGADLYDPANVAAGLILRFAGLKRQDGKRFLEKEIHLLQGTYSPINADGTIGLKRANRVLAEAVPVATLDESNVVTASGLTHDLGALANQFRIEWNFDPVEEEFTRLNLYTYTGSVSKHGPAKPVELKFKGLHGARHTGNTIADRIAVLRDRYGAPPLRVKLRVLPSLNGLELGDVVRVNLASVRDFTGEAGTTLARSFEVQGTSIDWVRGSVELDLFGSTYTDDESPTGATVVLPDGFYTGEGTNLATVLSISGGVVQANGTITGTADLTAPASIFYYAGDLTIPAGVTVSVVGNVQLRIRGGLTINGTIDGIGDGLAGVADSSTIGAAWALDDGAVGFLGPTICGPGISRLFTSATGVYIDNVKAPTRGLFSAFPRLNLVVEFDDPDTPTTATIAGIPTELRGTSGGPGACLLDYAAGFGSPHVDALGGTGGDSGAGLAIICRGIGFGLNGLIDLSGDDGADGVNATFASPASSQTFRTGGGAGGCPGALLILLDGAIHTVPDLTGHFTAERGATPYTALRPYATTMVRSGELDTRNQWDGAYPWGGSWPEAGVPRLDMANAAARVQYLPYPANAAEDANAEPAAPSGVTATGTAGGIVVGWVNNEPGAVVEVYASAANDRTGATLAGEVLGSSLFIPVTAGQTRYFWLRARLANGARSAWVNGGAALETETNITATATAGSPGEPGLSVAEILCYRRSATAPATPTGGSYNFATHALTPPSGWSAGIPAGTDPCYVSITTAVVTDPAGTDSTLTWSAPVLVFQDGTDGTDGQAVDMVFRRSATQPSTPAASSGVPAGWYTDVNSVPAGADPIWSSVGTRPNPASNWTWQTPIRVDGGDGFTSIPAPFGPGLVGGVSDCTIRLNWSAGAPNDGEVFVSGSVFIAPNGTEYSCSGVNVGTPYGEGVRGRFFLMFVGLNNGNTRFSTISVPDLVVPVRWNGTSWEAFQNDGTAEAFTPLATDTLFAVIEAEATTGGLTRGTLLTRGLDGVSVANVSVFIRAATAPATPTGGSFNFGTQVLTPPSGWSLTIPTGTDPVWIANGIASVVGQTGTDTPTWSAPAKAYEDGADGTDGADGWSVAEIYCYRRSATAPATPTGGSFDFATNTLTPPSGWSASVPAGTDPCYVSVTTAAVQGGSGTDSSLTWTAPVVAFENGVDGSNGADGLSVAIVKCYRRSATTPSTPTGGSFNFGTLTLTPPSGWSVVPPAGTDTLYESQATASVTGPSGIDSTLSWSAPAASTGVVEENSASGTGASLTLNDHDCTGRPITVRIAATMNGTTTGASGATWSLRLLRRIGAGSWLQVGKWDGTETGVLSCTGPFFWSRETEFNPDQFSVNSVGISLVDDPGTGLIDYYVDFNVRPVGAASLTYSFSIETREA